MKLNQLKRTSAFAAAAALLTIANSANAADRFSLSGHIPPISAAAHAVGQLPTNHPVALALSLPLRNKPELSDLIQRLHNPADALYGKYLTPEQFAARFSPTQQQYQKVVDFARENGFTITQQHSNRLLVEVNAPAAIAEKTFGLRLQRYQQLNGRAFYAPDREPSLPASMRGFISNVTGLENATVWETHNFLVTPQNITQNPNQIGSGPGGGMTPTDIRAAYGLTGTSRSGAGQTLALFQLDGYSASDITAYQQKFGLRAVPLQNVFVGGATGMTGDLNGQGEVTLDIELQMALAPGATKIIVYQAPNSSAGVLAGYSKIATDNLAKSVSSSWGISEGMVPYDVLDAENQIFMQMAAQGQSMFAASGDSGAYDDGSSLSVDDPAAQPYVTGVGGTTLTTGVAGGSWVSEKTWSNTGDKSRSSRGAGSGGGSSFYWSAPSYQTGVVKAATLANPAMRTVPDVSLASDPSSGYSICLRGGWYIYGGTSCAAPLWSAFTALVNEQRASASLAPLGFANPTLYSIGKGARYASDFHDVMTSTNLYYPALPGYDAATGWGSFNGGNLLADLAPGGSTGGTTGGTTDGGTTGTTTGTTTGGTTGETTGGTTGGGTTGTTTGGTTGTTTGGTTTGGTTSAAGPVSLQANAGNSQVFLSWAPVVGATSYNIYRGTTAGGEAATPVKTGVTTTSLGNNALSNNTTYYYKVKAVTAAGETSFSPEANAKPSTTSFMELLGNPGFENGSALMPWSATAGVINTSTSSQPAASGLWKATICGLGTSDFLHQQVTIPTTAMSATLSFALWISTTETTTSSRDLLRIEVRDPATGAVLGSVGGFYNVNATAGYVTKSFNLGTYKGKTIDIWLYDRQDAILPTTFNLDTFSVKVN